ncbi:MAG: phage tail tape measure protein [Nitrospiraceae bacterium]|nr:phage tail tape measure protein [Nitrospiraceae bacterium]
MSDTMRLTLQLTAVDMLQGVLSAARRSILSLGDAGKKVQKDFDIMTSNITRGLRNIAVAHYGWEKMKTGINYAASLQEALRDVRMDITRSGESAADLNRKLAQVRSTAVSIQAFTPFSAEDVVRVEDTLLKAGLKMKDVAGQGGAAWAASALGTITGNAPEEMAAGLVHIAAPFNIQGTGYGKLADDLQRVATAGGMNMQDLLQGMTFAAGQAASIHIPLHEVLATIATVSKLTGMSGGRVGRNIQMFLAMLPGLTAQNRQLMQQLGISAYDAHGQIKPMLDIINQLRVGLGKLSPEQLTIVAHKLFGSEGVRVVNALMNKGQYSYESITGHMREALSLQDKINIKTGEYITNLHALQTTWQSTMATFFNPLLTPLTDLLKFLNDIASKLGEFGEKHPAGTTAFSGLALAGVTAVGGYGILQLLRGGAAGARVLKGMGGLKGLLGGIGSAAVGITEGKVVQAATGVTPVFVTNWPSNIGGGVAPAAGSVLNGGLNEAVTLAAIGKNAGLIGLTAAAAYGVGSIINKLPNWFGLSNNKNGLGGIIGEKLYNLFHGELKPQVTTTVNIDTQSGRVYTATNGMKNQASVNLKRGRQ